MQVKPVDKQLSPIMTTCSALERGWDRGKERRTGRKAECNEIKQKLLFGIQFMFANSISIPPEVRLHLTECCSHFTFTKKEQKIEFFVK